MRRARILVLHAVTILSLLGALDARPAAATTAGAWGLAGPDAWPALFAPQAAQAPPPPAPPGTGEMARVFLDCPDAWCDFDYFRTEITFVSWVRDRKDADVHILITTQSTGGGGREYTIKLIGLRRFDKIDHELHYVSRQADTEDETRKGIANTMRLGLVRYAVDTVAGRDLQVVHKPMSTAPPGPSKGARDPWDSWMFRASFRSSMSGEQSRTSASGSGSFSANRITEGWKFTNSVSVYYSQTRYDLGEDGVFTSISREGGATSLMVKSLGTHWAAGARVAVSSSTYTNIKASGTFAPAIEYDVYPYKEATRRQLTFNYAVGVDRNRYSEETIYGKTAETAPNHKLIVSLDHKQPWGSTSTSLEISQYLHDLGKHRLGLYGSLDLRIFKGFSFSTYGSFSRIRDQLYLPKGEATTEEVLVRQRQLATSYQYYFSIGFTYSFGSIYNNVVNPRFQGSSGGMVYYY